MHRGGCWCGCGIAADVEDEDNGDGGWAEHTIVEGNEMTRIRRNNMRLQSVDSSHCSGELVHGRRIVIIVMVQQCWWRLVSLLWYLITCLRLCFVGLPQRHRGKSGAGRSISPLSALLGNSSISTSMAAA